MLNVTMYNKTTGALGAILSVGGIDELTVHFGEDQAAIPGHYSNEDFVVDLATLTPVPRIAPIQELREKAWEDVKSQRNRATSGGCITPFGVVQTDAGSRSFINEAAMAALVSKYQDEPFSQTWTMADNMQVDLDADQMITVHKCVADQSNHFHAASIAAREAIDAATTLAEVEAVAWQAEA